MATVPGNEHRYPAEIVLGSPPDQGRFALVPDQLVVRFGGRAADKDVARVLRAAALEPVGDGERRIAPGTLAGARVHHVRAPRGGPPLEELARRLLDEHRELVEYVGPVYEELGRGPASAVAPAGDRVLVRFRDGAERAALRDVERAMGLVRDERMSNLLAPFHMLRAAPTGADDRDRGRGGGRRRRATAPSEGEPSRLFAALEALQRRPDVVAAELDWFALHPLQLTPDDTHWASQWNMVRIGAESAWDEQTGGAAVVIAVIDSGCDLTHPDLQLTPVATHFNAEQAQNGDPQPWDASPHPTDGNSAHGSLVAGIAAATLANSAGVAGLAGGCRVMPLRVFPGGFVSWIAAAINWASANGAHVINMSLGGSASSATVSTAVDNAWLSGVVLVAAAGNYYQSTEPAPGTVPVLFPARHPRVIAVGASDQADERKRPASVDGEAWGSHYGTNLDVMAPGQGLWSTDIQGAGGWNANAGGPMGWFGVSYASCGSADGDYFALMGGTSGASPHVAGLAALLRLRFPALTNQQVRDVIERTCDKASAATYPYAHVAGRPNGTWHEEMGHGRIQAAVALRYADLMVSDHDLDTGAVPSSAHNGSGWVPKAFWRYQPYVTQASNPTALPTAHQPAMPNQDNHVHALVRNLGPADATNIQVTWHIVDYPGTELVWPVDWNAGNQIASASIPFLAAGSETPVEALWPQALVNVAAGYGHPCMMVQVSCAQDVGGDLGTVVYEFNNIAHHNISFAAATSHAPGAGGAMRAAVLPFAVGHRASRARRATLVLELGAARRARVLLDPRPDVALPYVDRMQRDLAALPDREARGGLRAVVRHEAVLLLESGGCRAEVRLAPGSVVRLPCAPGAAVGCGPSLDELRWTGAAPVVHGGRTMLLLEGPRATVELPLEPGRIVPMALVVAPPDGAAPGERFTIDATQLSEGKGVGGVTFVVSVP